MKRTDPVAAKSRNTKSSSRPKKPAKRHVVSAPRRLTAQPVALPASPEGANSEKETLRRAAKILSEAADDIIAHDYSADAKEDSDERRQLAVALRRMVTPEKRARHANRDVPKGSALRMPIEAADAMTPLPRLVSYGNELQSRIEHWLLMLARSAKTSVATVVEVLRWERHFCIPKLDGGWHTAPVVPREVIEVGEKFAHRIAMGTAG